MILYNTTFQVEEKSERDFVAWLKSDFMPHAADCGLTNPMLARLVSAVEPGCSTYALHLEAPSMADVEQWEKGGRQKMLVEIFARWQYGVLAFSTPMEKIEL